MIDDTTKAQIDAEEAKAFEDKTQAKYEAKPCCGRCGHHPGDALHVCRERDTDLEPSAPPVLMAPGGVLTVAEYEAALEVEGLPPPNKQDLIAKVNEWMPDATPGDKIAESKRLIGRWMLMDIAYKGGLRVGRDLRERTKYGKGWIWPELEPLTPRERTYVLGKVREKVLGPEAKA